MHTENKNNKRKFHINAFDILVIILVIACVAGAIVRHTILERIQNATAYETYYVYFDAEAVSYSSTVALENTHDDTDGGN